MPASPSRRAQLAARFMRAFGDHDTDAILGLMSTKPIWEFAAGAQPFGVRHDGRAAVRKAIEDTWKNFPDISYTDLRIYDAGDSIIYEVLTEAPSKKLRVQSVDIMTFDADDKIHSKRTYRKVVDR